MSDRFFLNKVGKDDSSCNSEYLFDRSSYIREILATELIQCAILSTYGFNIAHSQNELADLLGIDSKVPCLILHGDKRKVVGETSLLRKRRQYEYHKENERISQQQSEEISLLTNTECCKNNMKSLHSNSDIGITEKVQSKYDTYDKPEVDIIHISDKVVKEKTSHNNLETLNPDFTLKGLSTYPESVFVERIVPQWVSKYTSLHNIRSKQISSSNSSSSSRYIYIYIYIYI
jgi:hypothetical protein